MNALTPGSCILVLSDITRFHRAVTMWAEVLAACFPGDGQYMPTRCRMTPFLMFVVPRIAIATVSLLPWGRGYTWWNPPEKGFQMTLSPGSSSLMCENAGLPEMKPAGCCICACLTYHHFSMQTQGLPNSPFQGISE